MENNFKHNDTYLARWLAGEISDEELQKTIGEKEFRSYAKIRKALAVQEALDRPAEQSFATLEKQLKPKKAKLIQLKTRWAVGVAATLLAIFGLFMFFSSSEVSISTDYGQRETLTLIDGSEVILNSKSELSYNEDQWEDHRTIHLDGEAYFKVAKGKTFTVETSNGKVQVLGTEFNVNSTQDYFDVVCYEGKVKVTTNDNNEHILLPQKNLKKINGLEVKHSDIDELFPGWIKGETSFRSTPLYVVVIALENQYHLNIDTKNIDASTNYTGAFPNNDLKTALKVVFEPLNINYTISDKNNIKLNYSQ